MIPKSVRWAALVIIGSALAVVYAYSSKGQLNFLETMAFAQLLFTILAFGFILYTLYASLAQLRRSMAKPKLSLAFSEDGKTEATIDIVRGKSDRQPLSLWIFNNGNAVTKTFQIDVEVPDIFTKPSNHVISTLRGNKRIYSYYNDGKFTLFVSKPFQITNLGLSIKTNPADYEKYPNEFRIKYRIYGDWAETQEGKLKVICKKKYEVS